jgi:lysozyme
MEMKELLDQLKLHEGSRTHAYECPMGYLTIGVGRNIDAIGGLGLSDDEINYLLRNDIERCYRELEVFSWFMDLDQVRQEALVNMCFNLGFTRLLKFKNMLSSLAEGRYKLAAADALDSKWAKQVGQRAKDIAHMLELGQYP